MVAQDCDPSVPGGRGRQVSLSLRPAWSIKESSTAKATTEKTCLKKENKKNSGTSEQCPPQQEELVVRLCVVRLALLQPLAPDDADNDGDVHVEEKGSGKRLEAVMTRQDSGRAQSGRTAARTGGLERMPLGLCSLALEL